MALKCEDWSFASFVSFSVQNAFKQENTADDETPTDAYSLFDTSLGGSIPWQKQEINLQLSVSNIFDQKYIDHLSTLKEVGLFNPGRSFNISLRIPFWFKKLILNSRKPEFTWWVISVF